MSSKRVLCNLGIHKIEDYEPTLKWSTKRYYVNCACCDKEIYSKYENLKSLTAIFLGVVILVVICCDVGGAI